MVPSGLPFVILSDLCKAIHVTSSVGPDLFPGRGSLNHSLARQLSPSSQARDAKHDKMAPAQPELKKVSLLATPGFRQLWRDFLIPDTSLVLVQYLDKRLFVQLNGSRKVIGVLRGYDVRPATFHPRTDRPYGS